MIVFIHLNNDFSGSPRVLRDTISVAELKGLDYKLYVSNSSSDGFLNSVNGKVKNFWYKRFPQSRLLTFIALCISQLHLFTILFLDKDIKSDSVIYLNTLLPFGANFYALLSKKKLICHVHELSLTPIFFNNALLKINRISVDLNIFVSKEHFRLAEASDHNSIVIPNCIDDSLLKSSYLSYEKQLLKDNFSVLMISSPARYKGIPEFLSIAGIFANLDKNISFDLVLNCSHEKISQYVNLSSIPSNVTIFPVTESLSNFYSSASIIINLSRTDMWIETFGLTLLEGMAFGLPCIAPNAGGPIDFVEHDKNGFLIDSRDQNLVVEKILELFNNVNLYKSFSIKAREKALGYSFDNFKKNIAGVLDEL
jgi:glycosyltransferase involved in cell wall biosynthesis